MNSGVCSVNQLSNTFTCTCANYYYGNRCECMHIHVYVVSTETCVLCYLAVNQCFTQPPCQNGGTCTPGPSNTFTCQCLSSYTGTFCEQGKTPSSIIHDLTYVNNGIKRFTLLDICSSMPCMNGATCLSLNNNQQYYCQCAAGFSGTTCSMKTDCVVVYARFCCVGVGNNVCVMAPGLCENGGR